MKLMKYVLIVLLPIGISAYSADAVNEGEDHLSYGFSKSFEDSDKHPFGSLVDVPGASPTLASQESSPTISPTPFPTEVLLEKVIEANGYSLQDLSGMDQFILPDLASDDVPSEVLLPDLQNLPPTDLHLMVDTTSGRKYIRFTNEIWNSGPGVVELIGKVDDYTERIKVEQQLFSPKGEVVDSMEVGEFVYHPEHKHMHLENFALYEVWSVRENSFLDTVAASGGKISYCVMDRERIEIEASSGLMYPEEPVYTHCDEDFQGLSPGWIDVYEYNLPDQWVDITGLPNGIYAIVSTVNPDRNIQETNFDNNRGVTNFILEDFGVRTIEGSLALGYLQQ